MGSYAIIRMWNLDIGYLGHICESRCPPLKCNDQDFYNQNKLVCLKMKPIVERCKIASFELANKDKCSDSKLDGRPGPDGLQTVRPGLRPVVDKDQIRDQESSMLYNNYPMINFYIF